MNVYTLQCFNRHLFHTDWRSVV